MSKSCAERREALASKLVSMIEWLESGTGNAYRSLTIEVGVEADPNARATVNLHCYGIDRRDVGRVFSERTAEGRTLLGALERLKVPKTKKRARRASKRLLRAS